MQALITAVTVAALATLAAPAQQEAFNASVASVAAIAESPNLSLATESSQASAQYLYVMDAGNARVQKFDLRGNYITQFGGTPGINLGAGLAIDGGGNTWVTAQGSDALMLFDPSGAFVRWFGSTGSANGQFVSPDAVAFTSKGDMWVSDLGNYRLQRFNSAGAWQQSIGGPPPVPHPCSQPPGSTCPPGSENGQIAGAWSVITDPSDNVYVVDYDNHRVQKFNSSGTYLSTIGSDRLASPYDAAVDASGNIWIVDLNRVQKFDSSGNFVTEFGTQGSGNGQLMAPFGIAIDASGNIWIADNDNNRVQKFDTNGHFLLGIGAGYNGVPGNIGDGDSGDGQFTNPSRVAIANR